jgi:tetrapyrrole methylase family protein/MazG family protein
MSERFYELVQVMQRLRGVDGCPWDRQQTRASLKPFLLEETYEVLEALDQDDPETLKEELGDVLFQVLFHAQIAREQGEFTIDDVVRATTEKMVRRHPHVFGAAEATTPEQALEQWERLKGGEQRNAARRSVLDGVPKLLPALMRAYQMQQRAARVGFDWGAIEPVWDKLAEEMSELAQAAHAGAPERVEAELGDLLFSAVNLARHLGCDPEQALRHANDRFAARFQHVEQAVKASGRSIKAVAADELDALWEQAKRGEAAGASEAPPENAP